jgi:FAD/FMN-containing dehydrogenase/Fe-S oxidoreductase
MSTGATTLRHGDPALAARLRREIEGDVLFDPFSRGRYSIDASIYQIEPIGVVVPRRVEDIDAAIGIAREEGIPVLPRGAGTSQCGQTVGEALVIDVSKYLNKIVHLDEEGRRVKVQPGIVLDQLNAKLKSTNLFFPVDVSPANRATIGGMTGNNSCGARSIRYGNMVHNVHAIDALLADGTAARFGEVPGNLEGIEGNARYLDLVQRMRDLYARERKEIDNRIPKLLRKVGGYNIDMISPKGHNMAHLLVGSEGTLAFFKEIELDLQPIPPHRVLGVCHFPTFYKAMESTRHIVDLKPTAVELVDRTLIDLAREIDVFRPTIEHFVKGSPESILLVEFAAGERDPLTKKLQRLEELMSDLGFPESVFIATDPDFQKDIWEVRKAGLNIMMSMKGEGKPVSFIEDCAVSLENLAAYTKRLNEIFKKHGTSGTWYAHASVGTLHVRPILNMKTGEDTRKMRAIAEECFATVREYKGSFSGEHGDGLVRSEWIRSMYGDRIANDFEEVKDTFDYDAVFNPGKIVRPPRMDDRTLFRYKPDYAHIPIEPVLDWSAWGGFPHAVEMCNNNGACRKANPGVMCPSYRATKDEQHVTRGRANSLRLALSGQLGPDAFTSDDLYDTLDLCVSCKGCKRECPTGVDMAKMKIEFLHHYRKRHGLRIKDRLVAYLPRYAPTASKYARLANLRNHSRLLRELSERLLGLSAKRSLPEWRKDPFLGSEVRMEGSEPADVVLFADTFNRWFEPENLRAAVKVLQAGGYRVVIPRAEDRKRPLCCGRTFLAAGLVDEARKEAVRTLEALKPHIDAGATVVGLEPSCIFGFRDEYLSMLPGELTEKASESTLLFEEFLKREHDKGKLDLPLKAIGKKKAKIHGHCHQKAFAAMGAVETVLKLIPDLEAETIESSCCGMAGAFGYEADHYDVSMKMAELNLLPAVRETDSETIIVADGTSCRHQIEDGANRNAVHVARVLGMGVKID